MRRKRRIVTRSGGAGGTVKSTGSRGSNKKRGTKSTSLHHRPASATQRLGPRPEEGKRTLRSSNCDIQQCISTVKQTRDQVNRTSCDVFMQDTNNKPSNKMPPEPQQDSPLNESGTKAASPAKASSAAKTTGDSAASSKTNAKSVSSKKDDLRDKGKSCAESPPKKEEKPPQESGRNKTTKNCSNKNDTNSTDESEAVNGKVAAKKKRSLSVSGSSVKSDTGSSVEDNGGPYMCTYCDEVLDSAHDLTSHIRQHNNNDHTHTCKLCGKTLSSASSLDRHMLVHSGERPFKCKLCGMAFTTNGNMHRHMRTHGESEDSSDSPKSHSTKTKKATKRKSSQDSEIQPPSSPKKPEVEPALPEDTEQLHCPVCAKTFLCKYGLQTHMDTHPNDPIYCKECGNTLKNYTAFTEHQCVIPNGKECEDNGSHVGFHDLSFVDFSANKFTLIAKTQCEYTARRPSSAFHSFECFKCKKAFPCSSALHLHLRAHTDKTGTYCPSCDCNFQCEMHMQTHQLKHRKAEQCERQENGEVKEDEDEDLEEKKKPDIPLSNKDDFFALLQLQNRGQNVPLKAGYEATRKEEPFENPSYFVHAKPRPPSCLRDNEEEPASDFADIQSIISVTSTAAFMSSIRSSPIAASPASPVQVSTQSSPESPLVADSANASPDTPSKDDSDQSSENHSERVEENVHTDEQGAGNESFSCKSCNQVFKSSNALKRHNRSHSQGCTVYSCNSCSYTSLDKSTLIRHMRTHNGERPFQCAICKFAFTTKANCERHVRKRHKKLTKQEIKNAMQYNPNMAEQKAPDLIPSDHNNSETRCKYCNVDFKFNRVLRHHLRSLNNSCSRKPYCCALCRLGFSTKNNCIRHVMKQHPNMKDNISSLVSTNIVSDTSDQESAVQVSDDGSPKNASMPKNEEPPKLIEPPGKEENKTGQVSICQGREPPSSSPPSQSVSPLPLAHPHSQEPQMSTASPVLHPEASPSPPILAPQATLTPPPPSSGASLSLVVREEQPLNLSTSSASKQLNGNAEDEFGSMNDMVLAANSLVSLSEMPPPQEEPLNLAPHALDLSVKAKDQEATDLSVSPKPTSIFSISHSSTLSPPPLLSVCYSASCTPFRPPSRDVLPLAVSAPPVMCTPIPPSHPAPSLDVYKMTFKMVNHKLSTRNERAFQCEYCSAGFTLKSNMERHIKRKHPEFARPARSRNFIPALIQSNTPKQGGSTLSSKTRAALRDVLSNKANSLAAKANPNPSAGTMEVACEDSSDTRSPSVSNSMQNIPQQLLIPSRPTSHTNIILSEQASLRDNKQVSDDSDATPDLASVSSVIDTANTQTFRKYFGEAPNDDKLTIRKDPQGVESKSDVQQAKTSLHEQSGNHTANKKRSAYADSPNSVLCPYCPRKFPWSSSLQRHLLTHTGHKPFKCPKCPIYFTTKSNCERHLLRKHGHTREVVRSTERNYKCNTCPNSSFSTAGNLRKHYYLKHWVKTCTRRDVQKCHEMTTKPEVAGMEENMDPANCPLSDTAGITPMPVPSIQASDTYECHCCKEMCKSMQELVTHMQGHEDSPFSCHICNSSYSKRDECLMHIKTLHGSEYQQLMAHDSSDKTTPGDLSNTEMPMKSNHPEQISPADSLHLDYKTCQLACSFCPKRVWTSEDLKQHMSNVHVGEKMYSCDICHLQFVQKNCLVRHRKMHGVSPSLMQIEGPDEDASSNDVSLPGSLKKHSQNSLLYMIPQTKTTTSPASTWSDTTPKTSTTPDKGNNKKKQDEGSTELIQNLLGIDDSSVIEKMLDSAASAAQILGMNKV